MALRFRRSIKLAPGIRLNIAKSSGSLSFGPRGATINVGPRGVFRNIGVPGTGLSSRSRIAGGRPESARARTPAIRQSGSPTESFEPTKAVIVLSDDGSLGFLHEYDEKRPLSAELVHKLKAQHGDHVRAWLEKQCAKQNEIFEKLGRVHLDTPPPDSGPKYTFQKFKVEPPVEPTFQKPRLLDRLFPKRRRRLEAKNRQAREEFEAQLSVWRDEKAAHREREKYRKRLFEKQVLIDVEAMQEVLEERLHALEWPRETLVSFEIRSDGETVLVDVDLPEIEDLPEKQLKPYARGIKVSVNELSDAAKRKLYMTHVHAIGFRIIGTVFSVLPRAHTVVLSGFSQRPDKATGRIIDHYLYSVRVPRADWQAINFENLQEVDVVEAFGRFDIRRKASKTGVFTLIEPFDA